MLKALEVIHPPSAVVQKTTKLRICASRFGHAKLNNITKFQNQGLDSVSKYVLVRGLAALFLLLPNLSAWNPSNI